MNKGASGLNLEVWWPGAREQRPPRGYGEELGEGLCLGDPGAFGDVGALERLAARHADGADDVQGGFHGLAVVRGDPDLTRKT